MLKGSVYSRRWVHKGKKRKAWGVRYSVNGKVVRRIVAATREGAEAELERLKEDHKHRRLGLVEGKTLRELAVPFLEHKRAQERDIPTLEARLKNLLAQFGETPLEAVEEGIDAYVLERRHDGASNGTINRELAVLAHMLRLAVRKFRWLRHEPYIENLQEAGAREREWSEAEEEALFNEFGQDLRDLVETALLLGVRQSDLTRLAVEQVDLEGRVIAFRPKKKSLKRLLPIGERLYYLLTRRIAGLSATDLVFSNGSRRWERWHIRNRLQAAMKRVGIENLRFHDLRHSAASRLRRRGADMEDIRRILGHRGKHTTEGYVHYQAEQLRPVLALLESTKVTQDGDLVSGRPSNPL